MFDEAVPPFASVSRNRLDRVLQYLKFQLASALLLMLFPVLSQCIHAVWHSVCLQVGCAAFRGSLCRLPLAAVNVDCRVTPLRNCPSDSLTAGFTWSFSCMSPKHASHADQAPQNPVRSFFLSLVTLPLTHSPPFTACFKGDTYGRACYGPVPAALGLGLAGPVCADL